MRSVSLGAAAFALLSEISVVSAQEGLINSYAEAVRGEGFLAVPVGTVDRPASSKRAEKAFEDQLYNKEFFYATEVDLGNPSQRVTVLVDTGSSELWVNPDCRTTKTKTQSQQCVKFGKYDPSKSKNAIGPFGQEQLNYGDPSDKSTQTSATIQYWADAVALGGAKITNQTFGVVTQSKGQSQGIIGLAPDLKAGYGSNGPYSLVLSSMASQGVIASRVYALDLRHSDKQTGAVIYGGLDKSKFIGTLEKRPIVKGIGGEFRLATELTSVGVTGSSQSSTKVTGKDANVMLDSGTTISRVRRAVAKPILSGLGAKDDGEGYYQVPCSLQQSGGSVDFTFGQKILRVPLKDFILNLGNRNTVCYVGMVLTSDQQILGDSVLRAGYFVFDWDNQQVHIAQAADCGSNDIVAVSTGSDAVPSVTGNCKDSDAAFTGGALQATASGESLPTKAYTTVYTVTSCPEFDPSCRLNVVTTQVVPAATATGAKDNAGARLDALSGVMMAMGVLAMAFNGM